MVLASNLTDAVLMEFPCRFHVVFILVACSLYQHRDPFQNYMEPPWNLHQNSISQNTAHNYHTEIQRFSKPSWKVHGNSMEPPWNLHGTSIKPPSVRQDKTTTKYREQLQNLPENSIKSTSKLHGTYM